MSKESAFATAISVLIVIAVAVCVVNIKLTDAYFSDTESATLNISAGEWEPQPHICCICPDWGPCSACCWAVFIHGEGFGRLESVKLARNGDAKEAKKAWLINSSLIYAVFDLRGSASGSYDVIVEAYNGEAVLEDGFRVVGFCCRMPLAGRDSCEGENGLSLGKSLEAGGSRRLMMTIIGDLPPHITSVCLVAPGYMQDGEILVKESSTITLAFDTATIPEDDCDLILTTREGWHVLLEKAVVHHEIRSPVMILSVEPAFSPAMDDVSIQIECENLSAKTDFRLRKDGQEIVADSVEIVDSRQAACLFDLTGMPPGLYDLLALDAYGRTSVLSACFTLCAEPDDMQGDTQGDQGGIPGGSPEAEGPSLRESPLEVTPDASFKIVPESGRSGTVVDVIVHGGPFSSFMQARLYNDKAMAWSLECVLSTPSWMNCSFNLTGMPPGKYTLEILDQEGSRIYIAGIFEVL
ncbi:MAG: hypothetical protein JW854_08755 [Actinobacteria bacterium]|nr:hypothetical protein [Actinomycetota bacterium]